MLLGVAQAGGGLPDESSTVTCYVRSSDWAADRARLARAGPLSSGDQAVWRQLSDCILTSEIIAATLARDAELSDLVRRTWDRLVELKGELPEAASRTLTEDQARFERSLRRDLMLDRRAEVASDEDRETLRSRLSYRLEWLTGLETAPAGLAGLWRNATGRVSVTPAGPGEFHIEADRVDIDYLGWTCEFAGLGRTTGPDVLENSGDPPLRLSLAGGLLIVEQDPSANVCGGGASLSGVYFSTSPSPAP